MWRMQRFIFDREAAPVAPGAGGVKSVAMRNVNIYSTKEPAIIDRKEAESKERAVDVTIFVVLQQGRNECAL
jgi:hypothetical protein